MVPLYLTLSICSPEISSNTQKSEMGSQELKGAIPFYECDPGG